MLLVIAQRPGTRSDTLGQLTDQHSTSFTTVRATLDLVAGVKARVGYAASGAAPSRDPQAESAAEPGKQVAQKTGLNRAILGKGWREFELAVKNVARQTGCRIVEVPAAYTSQRCSACRTVDPESRESQAVYRCTTCGHTENADVNAAKNILAAGLAVTACGDFAVGRPVKQEPQPLPGGIPRL
ncbi:transposase [Nocardia sp. NPDC052112]|uniref:transposase n=1 Tax=Nocardia sp. NPDC052112 TaxID=3155646 RepID=UPI0034379518